MKQHWVLLLAFIINPCFAALPTCVPPCEVKVPSNHGGLFFELGLTNWRPTSENLDYAIFFPRFDSTRGNSAILNDGNILSVDPRGDVNFIVKLGYAFPCSNCDIAVALNNFNTNTEDFFVNPTIGFNLFAAFPLDQILGANANFHPSSNELTFFAATYQFDNVGTVTNLTIPTSIANARARAKFRDHIWDAELGQTLYIGSRSKLRLITGIRIVDLNQSLNCQYLGTGAAPLMPVTTSTGTTALANFFSNADLKIHQSSEFDGAGPRIGINYSYHIGNGFGLVAETTGALIIGDFNAHLFERIEYTVTGRGLTGIATNVVAVNNTPERELVGNSNSHTRVCPNLDQKIALDYTYQVCYLFWSKVTAELGYRVNHYWNVQSQQQDTTLFNVEDNSNLPNVGAANLTLDTSFAGPYFSVQVQL